MRKLNILTALVFIATITLVACGHRGGGGSPAVVNTDPDPDPDPGTDPIVSSPTASPIASFRQSVPSQDTRNNIEIFPGQANVWSIDQDFALVDGFDGQFNYALSLRVGSTGTFPGDQTYEELTFSLPLMGLADGVKVAAVSDGVLMSQSLPTGVMNAVKGTKAAFLNATSDSRLQQTLDLTSAAPPINLYWEDAVYVDWGNIPGYDPSYEVVIRQEDGALLRTLYANPASGQPKYHSGILLNQYAGRKIVLSFEEKSSVSSWSHAYAIIDAVSVKDAGGGEFVTNGSFETGDLAGWTANTPQEKQNMTSAARTLEGLTVTRSFYTVPNKLWGRWADVFENKTAGAIAKTVTYETSLGSDGSGIIYYAPGTGDRALTSWDCETGDRDVGLVFGNANTVTFGSDDGSGNVGSDLIRVTYELTVPAGGRVSIVNFAVMNGTDTGLANPGTTNIAARATEIDEEAARIVAGFWSDAQYTAGLTQEQIDAVTNFAR